MSWLKKLLPSKVVSILRIFRNQVLKLKQALDNTLAKLIFNHVNRIKFQGEENRRLEIGPGSENLVDFETLNIVAGPEVDYVYDAGSSLPFEDNTFDLIYASHVLEHIPWYKTEEVLTEWVRILTSGGDLEIWVPDGLKTCEFLLDAEKEGLDDIPDDWKKLNPRRDPYLWVNGRLLYGARSDYPSWHRAIFTPGYLKELFERVGLVNIKEMNKSEVRGHDHGWVNLGVKGSKP